MSERYRKKPVVIDAVQWNGKNLNAVLAFCAGDATYELMARGNAELVISTLEDGEGTAKHVASCGDYIIKGVKGEFYPCKPDIFAATYEPADTRTDLADALAVPNDAQVASACMSYRHDFGLLDAKERAALMWQAREWLHAWRKEFAALRAIGERASDAPETVRSTRTPLADALAVPEIAELIEAYEDILDYGIVFAKKDQQDRLNAAKEKFAAIHADLAPNPAAQAMADAAIHGTGIMQDGQRIDPQDFFATPDPAAIREALRIVQSHADYVRDEGAFDAGWNAAVQSIETEILALIAKGAAE